MLAIVIWAHEDSGLIYKKALLPSLVLSYDIFIQYNYIFIQLNVLEEIYEKIN